MVEWRLPGWIATNLIDALPIRFNLDQFRLVVKHWGGRAAGRTAHNASEARIDCFFDVPSRHAL